MGGTDGDEQFVDPVDIQFAEEAGIHAETHRRQTLQGLLAAQFITVTQHAEGSADVIKNTILVVSQQLGAALFLVGGDLAYHLLQAFKDKVFAFAQRALIGDLEEIAPVVRAFAEDAAYRQIEFADDLDERDIAIHVSSAPYTDPKNSEEKDYGRYAHARQTLHLTAAQFETAEPVQAGTIPNTYVCTEPVVYESVGVRIDRLLIEVKPQDIYATIDYTVIDEEKYAVTDHGLWFEFIDPQSTAEAYHNQRLEGGLSGGGGTQWLNEEQTRFRQKETLARHELHDTYTVRGFSAWEKNRYDTHTLTMRPATAEDMEAK